MEVGSQREGWDEQKRVLYETIQGAKRRLDLSVSGGGNVNEWSGIGGGHGEERGVRRVGDGTEYCDSTFDGMNILYIDFCATLSLLSLY